MSVSGLIAKAKRLLKQAKVSLVQTALQDQTMLAARAMAYSVSHLQARRR